MTSPQKLSSPVYQFPMSGENLLIIARITLMWGQIDTQVDAVIMKLFQLSTDEFDALFANKTVGPKIEFAAKGAHRCASDDARLKLRAMIEAITPCQQDRNIMTHGLWGFQYDRMQNEFLACAWSRNKQQALYAAELPSLHERVVVASQKSDAAFFEIVQETPAPAERNRFAIFSEVDPAIGSPGPPRFER